MTREALNLFVTRFVDFASWATTKQVDYLAYYLLTQPSTEIVTVVDVEESMALLDIRPYSRLSVYLSEEVTKRGGRYIKHPRGYRLERSAFDEIRIAVDAEPKRVQVAEHLLDMVPRLIDSQERAFLEEAIRSYRVESYRAAIIMVWILTMDHLQKFIFGNHLDKYNVAIAAHSDKKMKPVVAYDDFSDFKESRVIELMRSANIISHDVRKILDEKLGIRNSAGHPSRISFSAHKTTEFALDLIENVLLKY